jgi:hypothetical protein
MAPHDGTPERKARRSDARTSSWRESGEANRVSVTVAAQSLQDAELIKYRRRVMQIRDRARLEALSCECHVVVKARFDALLSAARLCRSGNQIQANQTE